MIEKHQIMRTSGDGISPSPGQAPSKFSPSWMELCFVDDNVKSCFAALIARERYPR